MEDGDYFRLCCYDENESKVKNTAPYSFYAYDKNKSPIEAIQHAVSGQITGINNIKYIRVAFSGLEFSNHMFLIQKNSLPSTSEYLEYKLIKTTTTLGEGKSNITEIFADLYNDLEDLKINYIKNNITILANGDSITYGHVPEYEGYNGSVNGITSYIKFACDDLRYNLVNYAISMSELSMNSQGNPVHTPLVARIDQMQNTADLIWIAIGSNDFSNFYDQLGTFDDRINTTFYGSLHIISQYLRDKYNNIPIIFSTPIRRYFLFRDSSTNEQYNIDNTMNLRGKQIDVYRNAMIEVANYYNIFICDMYNKCGINAYLEYDRTNFIPDGIHPNYLGHQRMSIECKAMLKYYIG